VNQLALYTTMAGNYTFKIVRRLGAGSVDVIASIPMTHAGGGWQYIDIDAFNVPSDGAYHLGSTAPAGSYESFCAKARAFAGGDIAGAGIATTEDSSYVLGVRAVYG
jgi:hypothetical protein